MKSQFFRLNKLKIIILVITFILIFFINIPALFQPCNWLTTCPDYLVHKVISIYPNFYTQEICGGIAGNCFPSSWSLSMLVFDIITWIIINLVSFSIINKFRK